MSARNATTSRPMMGALAAALLPALAAAQEGRIVVPLSDPGRPATLEVALIRGGITIKAYDGKEVVIEAGDGDGGAGSGSRAGRREDERRRDRPIEPGLHRIPNTSVGLTAEEHGNVVTVAMDWTNNDADLVISVPKRTSVHAHTVNNGDLVVTGVEGEHELSNVNGDIVATDVAGTMVAATNNGDMKMSFVSVSSGKPMSFTSFNGDMDIAFPANLSADLRISGARDDVLTDFDVKLQPRSTSVEPGGDAGHYRVRLDRETRAVVGNGGPEIRFKTFNGDIVIRKR